MTAELHIVNDSSVRLWNLSSRERIARALSQRADVRLVDDEDATSGRYPIVLVRGDYLFDNRILLALLDRENVVLQVGEGADTRYVAAHVAAGAAHAALQVMRCEQPAAMPPGLDIMTPSQLVPAYQENLRKADPAFVLPITPDTRKALERRLYDAAYKGITDLVTKWIWPTPARLLVQACVRLGIRPNHVTALNWLLVLVVSFLFSKGALGWGLMLAWLMTLLDTADGKLARVTLTSSRVGHLADHVLDIIHPPFWYLLWGLGLSAYQPLFLPAGLDNAMWLLFIGYTVGRIVEGVFEFGLARFGIFSWRPVDSYSRLVTARRNPCLVLLTAGLLLGRPDLGLEAVVVWTILSTLFLCLRLAIAVYQRCTRGPLTSWLSEVDTDALRNSLAARWFARKPVSPAPSQRS